MSETLEQWIAREQAVAIQGLLRCISATDLRYTRKAFGQTMVPAPGSVIASPVPGAYDPDPDYFFHWLRDSALVMDAVRVLMEDRLISHGTALFADFARFGLKLSQLDGEALVCMPAYREPVLPDHAQFLRPESELRTLRGDTVLADARFNPDGTLDILKWARPQHDGPASRALTLMRALPLVKTREMEELLARDLDFVLRNWAAPSDDIWEEDLGHHYYTRLVQLAALEDGAARRNDAALREAATELRAKLDAHWSPTRGIYLAHMDTPQAPGVDKDLDSATILGVLHAVRASGPHSPNDPRVRATLNALAQMFAATLPLNAGRAAPALGRYRGDVYYGGGAWYLATLSAAELHYLRGEIPRGDAFMETVRRLTPPDGALSEQVDPKTGVQTSARHLAWSYAAFITARAARARAILV